MHSSETPEQAIIRLYKGGKISLSEISKKTGARWQRVTRAVDEYNATNQIPEPKKRGRPPKNTQEVNKFIIDSTFQNRFMSCKNVSDQIKSKNIGNVSPTSVFRYRKKT